MDRTSRTKTSSAGKATREQILTVTLDFLRSEGLEPLTIRKIAERAGVNVAAVNYHFGSKDALVNEVVAVLTTVLRSAFGHLSDRSAPPRLRLHRFLDAASSALSQHAEVFRQVIGVNLASGDARRQYVSFIQSEGIRALLDTVREATGEADSPRLRLRVVQAIGGLAYPLLLGSFVEQIAGLHLADDAVRREHVGVCVETLIGPAETGQDPPETTDRAPRRGKRRPSKENTQ